MEKGQGVNINYHIEFDEHHYSVHYSRTGQELMCRATSNAIELFHKGERVVPRIEDCI